MFLLCCLIPTGFWVVEMSFFEVGLGGEDFNFILVAVVSLVFLFVSFWSSWYLSLSVSLDVLLFLFFLSMTFFVLADGPLPLLLFYDSLGVSSVLLVSFYGSISAKKSASVTMWFNKLGDVCLLFGLASLVVTPLTSPLFSGCCLLVCLAACVKSAQVPFNLWLPLAMEAPTPVSALVHSSTLVAAGGVLLFKTILGLDFCFVLVSAVVSLFLSSILAVFKEDLKKVVALSTLSQLGLVFLLCSIGLLEVALLCLVTHALIKSLLFLIVGNCMALVSSAQHKSSLGISVLSSTLLFWVLMALAGQGLSSGWLVKHIVLSCFCFVSSFLGSLFFISIGVFTFLYCFRLLSPLKGGFLFSSKSSSEVVLVLVGLALLGGGTLCSNLLVVSGFTVVSGVVVFCVSLVLVLFCCLKSSSLLLLFKTPFQVFLGFGLASEVEFQLFIQSVSKLFFLCFKNLITLGLPLSFLFLVLVLFL